MSAGSPTIAGLSRPTAGQRLGNGLKVTGPLEGLIFFLGRGVEGRFPSAARNACLAASARP